MTGGYEKLMLMQKLAFSPLPRSWRGSGSSQTLYGAVWEEFITRPTTMVELDLQLHMLKDVFS